MDTLIMAGFTVVLLIMAFKGLGKKAFIAVWAVGMVALLAALNYHITDSLDLTGL
ncbi:DUF5993 family protein [Salininema proteolyticum]|uniref:DUF5993 family protein n=1 Tax=Salininema proteolyticum TaxID=1607685 RepID=A0ABV8TW96_9ACTN